MKLRTKRAANVRFVGVPHAGMAILTSADVQRVISDAQANVRHAFTGVYVKVQPTVRASERAGIDAKAIRERLQAAGAVAVIVAPVVVPDSHTGKREPDKGVSGQAPETHLRAYLDTIAAARKVAKRALEEAITSCTEAGL